MVNKLEYLKLIQNIITRMANNSFLLKGWTISLVSGILGILIVKRVGIIFYSLLFIPLIVFWFLDSYYLRQERLYRGLYDKIRVLDDDKLDQTNYSMKPSQRGEQEYDTFRYSYLRVLFSKTEFGFYIGLMSVVFIILLLILTKQ